MKQITEISENVDLIELDGRKIYLVGTAHVSKASAELVEECISRYHPDTVCVELCDSRAQALRNPTRWQETDIFKVVRSGKAYVLLAQLLLASFQRKIAKQFDIQPGEEMRRAIALADQMEIPISHVDRDIRITLKRAWSGAGLWSLSKLTVSLMFSVFSPGEVTEAEIEELKSGDALSALMAEFSHYVRSPGSSASPQ